MARTLDQLATAVRALSKSIVECDLVISEASNSRASAFLKRAKAVDEAFTLINLKVPRKPWNTGPKGGRVEAKKKWCVKAEMTFTDASRCVAIFRSADPQAGYRKLRDASARRQAKHRESGRASIQLAEERNTLPGAFAIVVHKITDCTPAEFMKYPSVEKSDVQDVIDFLTEGVKL